MPQFIKRRHYFILISYTNPFGRPIPEKLSRFVGVDQAVYWLDSKVFTTSKSQQIPDLLQTHTQHNTLNYSIMG
jgi:hypothetical protein